MLDQIKAALTLQFTAAIDMLENAIVHCPETIWAGNTRYWYIAYHTLFYLDYYLTEDPARFHPPDPFTLSEADPKGVMPDRVYTKKELLDYLHASRSKCSGIIAKITDESVDRRFINDRMDYPLLEILLYNMRHVQHHAGQLQMLLRQHAVEPPKWISRGHQLQ